MDKNPSSSRKVPHSGGKKYKKHSAGVPESLPATYGDTKIIALPRDPFWIYAYWEISDEKKSRLKSALSPAKFIQSRWILRVYNLGDNNKVGQTAGFTPYFDIPVPEESGSWHINCGIPNRRWDVAIGLITPDGKFIEVAHSNTIATPPYGLSPYEAGEEKWGHLREFYKKQVLEFSKATSANSSLNPARLMRERWEELMKLPSSGRISRQTKNRGKKSK